MKVITFGEIMLRLEPEGYNRFLQAEKYLATYGGGEANVAVSLANFGLDAAFVTEYLKKMSEEEKLGVSAPEKVKTIYCFFKKSMI